MAQITKLKAATAPAMAATMESIGALSNPDVGKALATDIALLVTARAWRDVEFAASLLKQLVNTGNVSPKQWLWARWLLAAAHGIDMPKPGKS